MSSTQNQFAEDGAKKTMVLVAAAAACLLITVGIEFVTRPAAIEDFGRNGEDFYPDFEDPLKASSLAVMTINSEGGVRLQEFGVEKLDNGQWVIPSHHNYPADATDQLAKTAASVIGIKRGALVTRWPADHAHYGVVNPKTESVEIDKVEGIGKRLTLRGPDNSVLVDYIIGNKVEDQSGAFYVRHPDEDEVYITALDIDLSTKFTDWIDTDMFDISTTDVVNVNLKDYQFNELNSTVTQTEETDLRRESSTADWVMEGLDTEASEVDKDAVRDTLNAISGLEIAGVRPKRKGLTPDLRLDRAAFEGQRDVDLLQRDLISRGFLLQPGKDGSQENLSLVAREGELAVGTNDGLSFNMYFGRVFTGSQEELEIGLSKEGDEGSEESEEQSDDESSQSKKPGRYVFVTVNFDKRLLGEEPAEPTEPVKPEELQKAEEEQEEAETVGEDAEDTATEGDDTSEEPQEDPLKKLQEEYDAAVVDYKADLEEYEAFQKKVKEGQEKAQELNRRFALWYYVIPGEDYDKLSLKRSDLIKAKEADEAAIGPALPPGIAAPTNGGSTPAPPANLLNGNTPPKPAEGDAPAEPAEGDAPAEPTEGDAPAEPTEGDAPAEPAEGDAPAEPAEGDAPAEPAEGDAPAEPAEGDAPAEPAEGDAPAEPAEGDAPAEPAEGDAPAEPAEGDAADQ